MQTPSLFLTIAGLASPAIAFFTAL